MESLLPSRHYLLVGGSEFLVYCGILGGETSIGAGQGGDLFDVFWRQGKAEDIKVLVLAFNGGGFGYRNCPIVQVPREDRLGGGDVVFVRDGGDDRTGEQIAALSQGTPGFGDYSVVSVELHQFYLGPVRVQFDLVDRVQFASFDAQSLEVLG